MLNHLSPELRERIEALARAGRPPAQIERDLDSKVSRQDIYVTLAAARKAGRDIVKFKCVTPGFRARTARPPGGDARHLGERKKPVMALPPKPRPVPALGAEAQIARLAAQGHGLQAIAAITRAPYREIERVLGERQEAPPG